MRTSTLRQEFEERGFVGPLRVFAPGECRRIVRLLAASQPPPPDWRKGAAVSSRLFFELGSRRAVLDTVETLLDDAVLLWGASVVRRTPGRVHPWHTDIETSMEEGRCVTVWIGLQHTTRGSALQLVPGSHRFGRTLQEVARERAKRRGEVGDADVEAWARELDEGSGMVQPDMGDGEALFFDGRLWHGSRNANRRGARTALLLQYATPDTPIRMPDSSVLEWPFRFLAAPRPGCIVVRGSVCDTENRMVPAPAPDHGARPLVRSWIRMLELPLERDPERGWKPHPVFRGPTRHLDDLSCHVSVLDPGCSPHAPHAHEEEEVLVVLDGEAELVLVEGPGEGETRVQAMGPEGFAYYPAGQRHTIRNGSSAPVTYLMFKWKGDHGDAAAPLGLSLVEPGALREPEESAPDRNGGHRGPRRSFRPRRLMAGPTRYLRKLRAHVTTLDPGGGYDPHVDAHDVAILVLEGRVRTLDRTVGRHGVIFCAAGEPHGMRNAGEVPARYLVFEFHGDFAMKGTWRRVVGRLPSVPRRVVRAVGRRVPSLRRLLGRR